MASVTDIYVAEISTVISTHTHTYINTHTHTNTHIVGHSPHTHTNTLGIARPSLIGGRSDIKPVAGFVHI